MASLPPNMYAEIAWVHEALHQVSSVAIVGTSYTRTVAMTCIHLLPHVVNTCLSLCLMEARIAGDKPKIDSWQSKYITSAFCFPLMLHWW
jgi:hypothetical protein